MSKQNSLLQNVKDVSFIIFVLTITFSAGGLYYETKQKNDQLEKLNCNFDKLIVKLKILDILPEDFCKIEEEKKFVLSDNRIPKPRKNTRRIANQETAIIKEDFETNILE